MSRTKWGAEAEVHTLAVSLPVFPTTGSNFRLLLPSCLSPGFSPCTFLSNLPMEAVEMPAALDAVFICTKQGRGFASHRAYYAAIQCGPGNFVYILSSRMQGNHDADAWDKILPNIDLAAKIDLASA